MNPACIKGVVGTEQSSPQQGSLTIVGTGMHLGQMTLEAAQAIRGAGRVFYVVADAVTRGWILRTSPGAESLAELYREQQDRRATYTAMVDKVVAAVLQGNDVCVAFYGHPGVFVTPGHEMIARLRAGGHRAVMLPGVSSADALLADLGIDPCDHGLQSHEATDFLLRRRAIDVTSHLLLWQVGLVGHREYRRSYANAGLEMLVERLVELYGVGHAVRLYEASTDAVSAPRVDSCRLEELAQQSMHVATTLLVPPLNAARIDSAIEARLLCRVAADPRRHSTGGPPGC